MIVARIVKAALAGSVAVFALLVTFDNITDYRSNYTFVQHVLSMDTTFPGNALMYRAITNPALWNAGYLLIIFGEGLTGFAWMIGCVQMLNSLRASPVVFNRSKRFVVLGAGLGFSVWYCAFTVVGGEWFLMWQSPTWNGQLAAFKVYMTLLGVLIFVNQADGEL
jgi:predicted small integral membrane protein